MTPQRIVIIGGTNNRKQWLKDRLHRIPDYSQDAALIEISAKDDIPPFDYAVVLTIEGAKKLMVGRTFSNDTKKWLIDSHPFCKNGTSFVVFNNQNEVVASYST